MGNVKEGTSLRVGKAVMLGWGIRSFRKNELGTERHAVWVSPPDEENWHAVRVDAQPGDGDDRDDDGWVNRLLDEAGVPG
jgi:hypothetical protein